MNALQTLTDLAVAMRCETPECNALAVTNVLGVYGCTECSAANTDALRDM